METCTILLKPLKLFGLMYDCPASRIFRLPPHIHPATSTARACHALSAWSVSSCERDTLARTPASGEAPASLSYLLLPSEAAAARRAQATARRKDAHLSDVVVSERWDKKANAKFSAPSLPFPPSLPPILL